MPEVEILRPWWLLALLPGLFILLLLWRRVSGAGGWEGLVDPQLQAHVLEDNQASQSRWPLAWGAIAYLLAVIVLAGPVWEQRPQPLLQATQAQVILLDVSRSMDTSDQKPTRLARAKHKVVDLLAQSSGMQTALVVFSEVAYVVSPLTDDTATLEAFLPAIETSVVPVQGSRLAPAIEKARELLQQAGSLSGSIVLITDASVTEAALAAARDTQAAGFNLSVLAVATRRGDPLRLEDGSLLEDASGNIAVTRLDESGLTKLASAGGGVFKTLSVNNDDIKAMANIGDSVGLGGAELSERERLQWVEYGPWILPLLLLLLLPLYRRGLL